MPIQRESPLNSLLSLAGAPHGQDPRLPPLGDLQRVLASLLAAQSGLAGAQNPLSRAGPRQGRYSNTVSSRPGDDDARNSPAMSRPGLRKEVPHMSDERSRQQVLERETERPVRPPEERITDDDIRRLLNDGSEVVDLNLRRDRVMQGIWSAASFFRA